jgi:hypothetical protein
MAIGFAEENGHVEIVKLFKDWGANAFNSVMTNSANDRMEIVKFCKKCALRIKV